MGFGFRGKGHREALLGAFGGTPASERAVGAAVNWLCRHQSAYGRWSLDFRAQCKGHPCSGAGLVQSDVAATAMAMLPLLAAGQTHKSKGPYRTNMSKAVTWLLQQQRSTAIFAAGVQPMYPHGLATLALCELYGMTKDEHVAPAARRAVAFIDAPRTRPPAAGVTSPGSSATLRYSVGRSWR